MKQALQSRTASKLKSFNLSHVDLVGSWVRNVSSYLGIDKISQGERSKRPSVRPLSNQLTFCASCCLRDSHTAFAALWCINAESLLQNQVSAQGFFFHTRSSVLLSISHQSPNHELPQKWNSIHNLSIMKP